MGGVGEFIVIRWGIDLYRGLYEWGAVGAIALYGGERVVDVAEHVIRKKLSSREKLGGRIDQQSLSKNMYSNAIETHLHVNLRARGRGAAANAATDPHVDRYFGRRLLDDYRGSPTILYALKEVRYSFVLQYREADDNYKAREVGIPIVWNRKSISIQEMQRSNDLSDSIWIFICYIYFYIRALVELCASTH